MRGNLQNLSRCELRKCRPHYLPRRKRIGKLMFEKTIDQTSNDNNFDDQVDNAATSSLKVKTVEE